MDTTDMIPGTILFIQRLHEHSMKVHEAVERIQPLVDALLVQDHEKMRTLHEQTSRIRSEADQIKLALYERIQEMHFRSVGSYAFSQYIDCQDRLADAASDFADLLMVRKTTLPVELHANFRGLVAHVIGVSRQTLNLAKELSSSEEAGSTYPQTEDAGKTIAGIIEGSGQAKRLGMQFAQCVYNLEGRSDPVTILFLDRYGTALRGIAEAAERTTACLRLMIP